MKKSRQKRVLIYVHNIFLKTTLSLDIPAIFLNFSNYRDICSWEKINKKNTWKTGKHPYSLFLYFIFLQSTQQYVVLHKRFIFYYLSHPMDCKYKDIVPTPKTVPYQ